MKKDLSELKRIVIDIAKGGEIDLNSDQTEVINRMYQEMHANANQSLHSTRILPPANEPTTTSFPIENENTEYEVHEEVEESLSLEDREKDLIQKALGKHRGKRKYAAAELGISERTLYRKIKEYNLLE
jgi:transcriptional regulator with PAS, ATPase and Fis domain